MIPGVVVFLLFTALGCLPLVLVGRTALRRRRALAAWVPVTARVVGVTDPRQAPIDVAMSRGRVATLGVYEYSVDGRTFEGYVPIDGPWREGSDATSTSSWIRPIRVVRWRPGPSAPVSSSPWLRWPCSWWGLG